MFSKSLQGTTVERVYWAVSNVTVPVIGTEFSSPLDARRYAEETVSAKSPRAIICTRMVFRYPEGHPVGGTLDTAVETEYVEYYELIRRPDEEDRY